MYEAVQNGDDETAREIHYKKILPFAFCSFSLSREESKVVQAGKMVLKWRKVISHETVRKPLSLLKGWEAKYLKSMAEHIELL